MNCDRKMQALLLGGVAVCALATAAYFGPVRSRANPAPGPGGALATESIPDQIRLNAVIRDFRAKAETGGHPDFESYSGSGRVGLLEDRLAADGKPVFKSSTGKQLAAEFLDSKGQPIPYFLYESSRGDRSTTMTAGDTSNGISSADSFRSWYRDTAGVNVSKIVPLVFNRVPGTNRFVFDSATDEPYKSRGGFFPIDNELFGNYASTGKNFHFTTELDARFVYEKGQGQVFTFTGDDDVWCFIDGRLVIDLGGLHSKKAQTLDLDRLTWLEDGRVYVFKIFHAERHTTQSNFRVETTLKLTTAAPPPTSNPFD